MFPILQQPQGPHIGLVAFQRLDNVMRLHIENLD
jgi:hypothetical protein